MPLLTMGRQWKALSARAKAGVVLAALVVIFALGASQSGDDASKSRDSEPAVASAVPEKAEPTDDESDARKRSSPPLDCLDSAGLEQVEKRSGDTWRGFDTVNGGLIVVQRLQSEAAARDAEQAADLVGSLSTGPYLITGPTGGGEQRGSVLYLVTTCLKRG